MKINHDSISQFCADLGRDPLLVQGAGGNISWKDGDTLWVKGSGTWLANAKLDNIFVPVDLKGISLNLARGNFFAAPEVKTVSNLRPSIETILHAIMPQRVVVHLHAINALAILVRRDAAIKINKISKKLPWKSLFFDYIMPGPELGKAINFGMKAQNEFNILFLKNHGIVIGGDSIAEVSAILSAVLKECSIEIISECPGEALQLPEVPMSAKKLYLAFDDIFVQQLAKNLSLYNRLQCDWALYPDHVVFLGSKPFIYESWEDFFVSLNHFKLLPDLIFIKYEGVFTRLDYGLSRAIQLRCYYDLISRIPNTVILDSLGDSNVSALLSWDAEKLRQQLSI
jgi:rhamnose utilization protein RhaD (predicted bifunctional aldolase and dehydrogenase)